MSSFPLYDSLSKDLPEKDLTAKQKQEFIDNIQSIDENGRDLIYTLVQFYYIENDQYFDEKEHDENELPYNGVRKHVGRGKQNLTWVLTDFPVKLRHMLYKFIVLHFKNMQEEIVRQVFVNS